MNIKCRRAVIHNFGSYSHSEVDLSKRGCCAVIGENHCKKDNAKSNGSGKSMLFSAICFALTGETISGLSTNLKNINIEDDATCWVSLEFDVDLDRYKIVRYHAPKSGLQIYKNGVEISGKGIRESNKVLSEHLPDLTKDLVASCLIIGQGMPNKFSSFSPSGRKDLLEKLTNSEFMLEDIKERLSSRQTELDKQVRQTEDRILVNKTNTSAAESGLFEANSAVANFKFKDYEAEILKVSEKLSEFNTAVANTNNAIATQEKELETLADEQDKLNAEKQPEIDAENDRIAKLMSSLTANKLELSNKIAILTNTIIQLKNVKDICPTCGQKLPGVVKQDTTSHEADLAVLKGEMSDLDGKINSINAEHYFCLQTIQNKYSERLEDIKTKIRNIKNLIVTYRTGLTDLNIQISNKQAELNKIKYDKENDQKIFDALKQQVLSLQVKLEDLRGENIKLLQSKAELDAHVSVLKKIETLIKRDFRGYLLTGIIEYLDKKAKEYCNIVFGTTDLNIYLDGNALNISYCNKMLDNLSGGERQRVDLILQFAIRDMLSTYLNYSSNILVLDEVFDGLDSISTDKILELISTKLKDVESVFIISHHSDSLNIGYDSEIKIIKDENGISEVY